LFTLALDTQHHPFLCLLAIAKVDVTSKRNGIWALKARLLESLRESWRQVFLKTRHGFIDIAGSHEKTSWFHKSIAFFLDFILIIFIL
jgi:hypothetical protein